MHSTLNKWDRPLDSSCERGRRGRWIAPVEVASIYRDDAAILVDTTVDPGRTADLCVEELSFVEQSGAGVDEALVDRQLGDLDEQSHPGRRP